MTTRIHCLDETSIYKDQILKIKDIKFSIHQIICYNAIVKVIDSKKFM